MSSDIQVEEECSSSMADSKSQNPHSPSDSMSPLHFFSDRTSISTREQKGKQKELVDDAGIPYDSFTGPASLSSHESSRRSQHLHSQPHKFTPPQRPTSPRKQRNSLLSFARQKKPIPRPLPPPPLVLSEVIEITRPYSYAQEEQERERLRDAAAQSIGLVEYASSDHHPDISQEGLDPHTPHTQQEPAPITDSPPSPPSPIHQPHIPILAPPALPPFPPFPASLSSLTKHVTLAGTFPKFFPPSSLLVYALAKQWKSRFIILTTARKSSSDTNVTHLHLFKSNLPSSSELHRLPITQDTAVYVTEQSGTSGKRDVKGSGVRASGKPSGKPSGTVVAIEQGSLVWYFEMQDPSERQQWIGAIKSVVLGQRSARAGLTVAPHTLSGHEPRGDMDVMLSMCLQASLSSSAPPLSSGTSPRSSASLGSRSKSPVCIPSTPSVPLDTTSPSVSLSKPPMRTSPSLEGLRSHTRSPILTPSPIPSSTTAKLELLTRKSSKKSQSPSTQGYSSSSSGLGSGPSSLLHSIPLHSKRTGNISAVMVNNNSNSNNNIINNNNNSHMNVQTHSARSSVSTTKTIRGLFGPRSRSPSPSEGEGEYAEESFGTVGHSLMSIGMGAPMVGLNINRTGSPMGRTDSPAPSVVSSGHDGSSGVMSNGSIHNGSVYNGATSSVYNSNGNGNGSINGIPATDLKIVKEDERCSPSPSPSPPTYVCSLPPQSTPTHSLQPPPRKKHTAVYPPADTIFQLTDKGTADTFNFSVPASTEDLATTISTPRAVSPVPAPNPARLSVLTTSTMTSGSGIEMSGSTTSSTPSHRWSRILPKRLTPPSGPLPLTPPQLPYESELSLNSSPSSTDSPGAPVWKRTSGSSSVSSASVRSSPVQLYSGQRASVGVGVSVGGGKRRSMPPPRPAPSFAPPPAPEQQQQQPQKTRLRTSIAQRALRLSLTAPRPPPSSALPPRPDEPTHRRSSSGNSNSSGTDVASPPPPPRPDSAASLRSISIKQRLRILSAPSPSTFPHDNPTPIIPAATTTSTSSSSSTYPEPPHINGNNDSNSITYSRATTPPLPGTPITTMQNHPSFLQLATPSLLPPIPPRNPLRPVPPERLLSSPELTSLSPPPRRGSKMFVTQQQQQQHPRHQQHLDLDLDLDLSEKVEVESELPDFSDIHVEAGSVVSLGSTACG